MLIECCSREVLEYEVKDRIRSLGDGEEIRIKITPCELLEGTFDLEMINKFIELE